MLWGSTMESMPVLRGVESVVTLNIVFHVVRVRLLVLPEGTSWLWVPMEGESCMLATQQCRVLAPNVTEHLFETRQTCSWQILIQHPPRYPVRDKSVFRAAFEPFFLSCNMLSAPGISNTRLPRK
jgi:hypothetical protein